MAFRDDLESLAADYGIETGYRDIRGEQVVASDETLLGMLACFVGERASPEGVAEARRARRAEIAARALDPIVVIWDGAGSVRLALDARDAVGPYRMTVALEEGETFTDEGRLENASIHGTPSIDGRSIAHLGLDVARPIPPGYHRCRIEVGSRTLEAALWSAPRSAHQGAEWPAWGGFAPTYALRSNRSLGVGDLRDLEDTLRWTASYGARAFATLPLLPTFLHDPCDPSPYAPVSRLFWNELFLPIEDLPELALSAPARALLASHDYERASAELRALPFVDAAGAMTHKRRLLLLLAETCFGNDALRSEIERDVAAAPELLDYARFRAALERQARPFRRWPERMRDGTIDATDVDTPNVRYHLYVQARMGARMGALAERAAERDVRLYLDLPLGAHPEGYDAWRFGGTLLGGCAAGAPPDTLFQGGQNWGFAPPHPERSRATGHDYFLRCLRHNLRHAGFLRIDHVMGLHHVYCVPNGMRATDGAYVRQPAEELYAATCIESQRHRAVIIGEDLGTVPSYVREAMAAHGLWRLHVMQYESIGPSGESETPVPEKSVACLNTHDMPTYAGYWSGKDIDERAALGFVDAREAERERDLRRSQRATRETYLERLGLVQHPAAHDALLKGELEVLSKSPSNLVLLNLEDLWGELEPQNLPGTGPERPNFRRKLAKSIEEMRDSPELTHALRALGEGRRSAIALRSETPPAESHPVRQGSRFGTTDDHLLNEGTHVRLFEKLGSHPGVFEGEHGTFFAVWAPNARSVSVIGDFNDWRPERAELRKRVTSGVWEGFIPGVGHGSLYKYHVVGADGRGVDKADPMALRHETPPRTASQVWRAHYEWGDDEWMRERASRHSFGAPCSIYEVHLGSWQRADDGSLLGYREIAPRLADHVAELGFTHVELMPVMEHPFYASWGYQVTGYFAPTSRYGTPEDLMYLVDHLHQRGIGVILDWVPGHFPSDAHGLVRFDGTCLYEHEDPRKGFHPDWKSCIFNYDRYEVQAFLTSSAVFWLDFFHADGLRVDGVASMLYLDYSRAEGEWIPNEFGGRENLGAIRWIRRLNEVVYELFPSAQTTAEESTSWPMVSRPTYLGGLGFGFKWDMGWMHDTLSFFHHDPVHRRYHQDSLTFRSLYAHHESFVLPLSHDEVVHGKGSLLAKMPGDDWQRFANLRTLLAYMCAIPGHKLLFMGSELAPWSEWSHDRALEWGLASYPLHAGVKRLVADLNRVHRAHVALHELDGKPEGFAWVETANPEESALAFERIGADGSRVLAVFNFTPLPRAGYRLGVHAPGTWREILNTDATSYGGSGVGNLGRVDATEAPAHGRPRSLSVVLPPLGALFFRSP